MTLWEGDVGKVGRAVSKGQGGLGCGQCAPAPREEQLQVFLQRCLVALFSYGMTIR